jgi:hypothetical protein
MRFAPKVLHAIGDRSVDCCLDRQHNYGPWAYRMREIFSGNRLLGIVAKCDFAKGCEGHKPLSFDRWQGVKRRDLGNMRLEG